MEKPQKTPPAYAIASVDHALRLATILQLEGNLTVAEAAERLGVARSTAHRLLQMLVYRDFAVQHPRPSVRRRARPGTAEHSRSATSLLRSAALPHMELLVQAVGESANLTIRTGVRGPVHRLGGVRSGTARRITRGHGLSGTPPFRRVATARRTLRRRTGPGLREQVRRGCDRPAGSAEIACRTGADSQARVCGQPGRSERGVVAVGVPVRDANGKALAGLSVSIRPCATTGSSCRPWWQLCAWLPIASRLTWHAEH